MDVSAHACRGIAYIKVLKPAGRHYPQCGCISPQVLRPGQWLFSSLSQWQIEYTKRTLTRPSVRTFSSTIPAAKHLPPAYQSPSPVNGEEDEAFHRTDGNPSLPLPPFMRKTPWRKTSSFERNIKNPRPLIEGGYTKGNKKTLRAKLKEAEFATRMQENPYARMLAEPVREDRFSQQRLPRHCMLKFQVVEDEVHNPATSDLEHADIKPTAKSSDQRASASSLVFLPLSLMGEALPKNKSRQNLTASENAAVTALHEDAAFTPHGPGSHLLARYDMLAWVSAGNKQERVQRVLSTRARDVLEETIRLRRTARDKTGPVVWQADMPELVLIAMRKVVKRLLAFMLKNKSSRPDREGILMEVPRAQDGEQTLALLDKVDGVACVLRLGTATVPTERRSQQHPPQYAEAQWTEREKGSFLGDVRPLPVIEEDTDARWPTLRYRSRRVMLYDCPSLLGGQEQAHKLIENTVFAQSEWLIVRGGLGTTQLQQWLFRLHGYLTHGKGEQTAIMMREQAS